MLQIHGLRTPVLLLVDDYLLQETSCEHLFDLVSFCEFNDHTSIVSSLARYDVNGTSAHMRAHGCV